MHPNGYGFLRNPGANFTRERSDPFVPGTMIEKFQLREGVLICLVGLVAGAGVSLAVTRTLSGLLFGVTPNDPATYTAIGVLLLAVGCAASYGPARRATRVSPIVALRE